MDGSGDKPIIFVSYRRATAGYAAAALHEILEQIYGKETVFMDTADIPAGRRFPGVIEDALKHCKVLLAVIGPDWLKEIDRLKEIERRTGRVDFVRLEIERTLKRTGPLVIPVLVDGAEMPQRDELPDELKSLTERQAVKLQADSWGDDIQRLLQGIAPAVPEPPTQRGAKPWQAPEVHLTHEPVRIPVRGGRVLRSRTLGIGAAALAVITLIAAGILYLAGDRSTSASMPRGSPAATAAGASTGPTGAPSTTGPNPSMAAADTATYRVVDIDEDDPDSGLPVRTKPDSDIDNVLAIYWYDAGGIRLRDQRGAWALAELPGWADARFLEQSSQNASCPTGFQPAAVTNIEEDHPDGGLNVRSGPRVLGRNIVAVLRWDAAGFCAARNAESGWRRVIVAGWVDSQHLAEEN